MWLIFLKTFSTQETHEGQIRKLLRLGIEFMMDDSVLVILYDIFNSKDDVYTLKYLRSSCRYFATKTNQNFVKRWWENVWNISCLQNHDVSGIKPSLRLLKYACEANDVALLESLSEWVKYGFIGDMQETHKGLLSMLFGGLLANVTSENELILFDLCAWSICVTQDIKLAIKAWNMASTTKMKDVLLKRFNRDLLCDRGLLHAFLS